MGHFDGLDVVVNNAGMAVLGDLDPDVEIAAMTDTEWSGILERNLTTCFDVTWAALPPAELAVGPGRHRLPRLAGGVPPDRPVCDARRRQLGDPGTSPLPLNRAPVASVR